MRLLGLLLVIGSLGLAGEARGGGEPSFRELEAKKACLVGNVEKGLEILADMYVATEDPTHIYNQGRCLQQNERYAEAIGRFREYLRKAGRGEGAGRREAERQMAECQKLLEEAGGGGGDASEKQGQTEGGGAGGEGALKVGDAEPGREAARAEVVGMGTAPAPAGGEGVGREPGGGWRVGGIVSAGFGVVAVLGGVALNVRANELTGEVSRLYNREADQRREIYETLAWSCYGVGAAALTVGAALYYIGWKMGKEPSVASVAVAPYRVGPRTGVVLQGRF